MSKMKHAFIQQCLDILKREDVKDELKLLMRPMIDMILQEIYPYIFLSIIFVFISRRTKRAGRRTRRAGRRTRRAGRRTKRRGGSIGMAIHKALAPGLLTFTQMNYKKKKRGGRRSRRAGRRTRRR